MKRFFTAIFSLILIAAFDAAALPKTTAKQVTVDPAGLANSTNTTVQLVLEDLDEKISVTATTSTPGVVRFSTPAEVTDGTGTNSAITPADLTARLVNTNAYLFSTNGYVRHLNGLIEQWGTTEATGDTQIIFPISFSNACFSVVASLNGHVAISTYALRIYGLTKTNCYIMTTGGEWSGQGRDLMWFAIGY